MNIAETELELFIDYAHVLNNNKVTIALQTDDPDFANEVGRQIWDQRFAFQGTKAEITEFCLDVLAFLNGREEATLPEESESGPHQHSCAGCEAPIRKK